MCFFLVFPCLVHPTTSRVHAQTALLCNRSQTQSQLLCSRLITKACLKIPFSGEADSRNLYMSKDGSIWQFFVLCLLALGDIVPKCYFFCYALGHPGKEKNCQMVFCPCQHFRGFQLDRGSKNLSKLGLKHNLAKATCVYPPQ